MIRRGIPGGSFKPLSESAIDKIHQTAMRTFEEIGFEVHSEAALSLFRAAGAEIDEARNNVRVPRDMVMELIGKAPSEIRLCGSEEKQDVILGGTRVYTGTGGTALYVLRADTGKKEPATLEDLKDIARLVDGLDNIHLFLLPTYPSDLPVERVDINRFFAGLDNTTKHIMGGVYTIEGVKEAIRMAEIIAGSAEQLRRRPLISIIACVMSPLRLDKHYSDLMITVAEEGIPLVVPSEPLCGATSPITLAGNILLQVTDTLMGVMLSQIVRPGTPVIYGCVATSTDPHDMKYLAGSVEMGLINAAAAQMSQFYRLPFYGTGGMTDSKVVDAQSGYESAISSLMCALAGANFIHDGAGLMEFALTVSYEKYVVDNEILGMVMRAVEGIKVDDETLAFDLIKETGPGGNFVTARHTRRFLRSEHYQPTLSDRDNREEWLARGGKEALERASEKAKQLIATADYSLPSEIRKTVLTEISGIVE